LSSIIFNNTNPPHTTLHLNLNPKLLTSSPILTPTMLLLPRYQRDLLHCICLHLTTLPSFAKSNLANVKLVLVLVVMKVSVIVKVVGVKYVLILTLPVVVLLVLVFVVMVRLHQCVPVVVVLVVFVLVLKIVLAMQPVVVVVCWSSSKPFPLYVNNKPYLYCLVLVVHVYQVNHAIVVRLNHIMKLL